MNKKSYDNITENLRWNKGNKTLAKALSRTKCINFGAYYGS